VVAGCGVGAALGAGASGGGTAVVAGILTSTNANGAGGTSFGTLKDIAGAAKQLALQAALPSTATASMVFSPQPVILVQDQFGNTRNAANGAADNLTVVTAARGLGTGTLQGTTNVTSVNGVASFSNLSYPQAETITIVFSSGSLTSVTSGSIVVSPTVLTVRANDLTRDYGAANPPLTVSYTGFVNGETLATSGVTGSPSVTTIADTNSPIGASSNAASSLILNGGTLQASTGFTPNAKRGIAVSLAAMEKRAKELCPIDQSGRKPGGTLQATIQGDARTVTVTADKVELSGEVMTFSGSDLAVRMITRRVLETFKYKVYEAACAREAVGVWGQHAGEIALLLTDIVMPEGTTGKELAEQLRTRKPGLRVILMSGYSAEVLSKGAEFLRRANSYFLQKPCATSTLLLTVRQCLDDPPGPEAQRQAMAP